METAICWDLDGTLIHAKSIWSRALHSALQKTCSNFPLPSAEDIRQINGKKFIWDTEGGDTRHLTGIQWWNFMNLRFLETYEHFGIPRENAQLALPYIREFILDKTNYTLYPDTVYILNLCQQQGIPCVLISNNYPETSETLKALALDSYFKGMVISGTVGYDKPHRQIFELGMSFCPEAKRFIMVGDNLKADIEGGKACGMMTIYVHREQNPLADYCFDDLASIASVI